MKINFFSLSLLTAFIILIIGCLLKRQNDISSTNDQQYAFTTFNRAAPAEAAAIMQHWKQDSQRIVAVKNIIRIDYVFMLVYCLYLGGSFLYFRRRASRKIIKAIALAGLLLIIIATLIDAIQDYKIYKLVSGASPLQDMRLYTKIKWGCIIAALLIFVIALLPRNILTRGFWQAGIKQAIRYLSQLFKACWLFFPGILFLLFPIFCFWVLGQGKDTIADFINIKGEPRESISSHFDYTRILFFIAIAFWAYVSWYSARIISYIKKNGQQRDMERIKNVTHQMSEDAYNNNDPFFEIGKPFLDEFPRSLGNCCFLVLELAVFQSSIIKAPISGSATWLFFFLGVISLRYINAWVNDTQSKKPGFRKTFWILVVLFLLTVAVISYTGMTIWALFLMLLFLHVIFIFYSNLRRVMMEEDALKKDSTKKGLLYAVMTYFCIPIKESGYFIWFIWLCIAGIAIYITGIFNLDFARNLGPFPFIIVAFAVLLEFGNIVTAFSARYKLNFHFILLIIAFMLNFWETHDVKTVNARNGYREKTVLKEYLNAWLNERLDSSNSRYDMYFVMSNGGASRSGYWTAAVLGKIEDSSLNHVASGRFSDHIFCLSGTSGGGVGVATFFSLLRNKQENRKPVYSISARKFLSQDYFTYTFARMLGPDFFNYIFHIPISVMQDRAGALESSFERSVKPADDNYPVPFNENFSAFPAMKNGKTFLPILFVNTTRMQDGNPGVVTNLKLDSGFFNKRLDVVTMLDSNKDISIATASILGARFPYLSPAGRIKESYFVDGGYFDNSGAGAIQEMIRAILNLAKGDPALQQKINRIDFKVLHIINSPPSEGFVSADIKEVAPIKNDLMSPVLTIVGAYDMQTTVNDQRLISYINDINSSHVNAAGYKIISLYQKINEWRADSTSYEHFGKTEPGYAMNWFMSDTTLRRIEKRLLNNPDIDTLCRMVRW